MSDRPEIKPRAWITVENTRCVVANVRAPSHVLGDCEVVCNPSKPANRDVYWDGEQWLFVKTGDYGGYADKYARLAEYVRILKKGN